MAQRRALVKQVTVGEVDYEAIHARHGMVCGICWNKIEDKYEYDHIRPIAKGGAHSTENIQLSHPSCNRTKNCKFEEPR